MKENKYDEESFFEKYSQMDRSKKGLEYAGEWESFKEILPNFKEKNVLDLACGYGWHCQYAIEKGAKRVVGVDISQKMLEVAKQKTDAKIEYMQLALEDIEFAKNSFDIVLSSLAFHYIKDFSQVVKKVYDCLDKNGVFVFSVEHPIFTSIEKQDWFYNDKGEIMHFPLDNYFYEGERNAVFLGEELVKYHRTLTSYINILLEENFKIKKVIEPMPAKKLVNQMIDELRRPMMLIIKAEK